MIKNKPLFWNNGEFPAVLYLIEKKTNDWLKVTDVICSAYEFEGKLYASGAKTSKNTTAFGMAFWNDTNIPVKSGLNVGDVPVWAVYREGEMYQLDLVNTTVRNNSTYAKFELTTKPIEILDNLYYSIDPVWPEITALETERPTTAKALTFSQFMDYKPLLPKFTTGNFVPEIVEGDAKLRLSKYFNACTIRFNEAGVANGYILLKVNAKPLQNSQSKDNSRTYKIYWK